MGGGVAVKEHAEVVGGELRAHLEVVLGGVPVAGPALRIQSARQ